MTSASAQAEPADRPSLLRTRLGVLTLLLLCGVQFLDVVDSSITNVAFPSIQHALHFSQQSLQWVASGYLLTYGGFLLLGGRLADLLGRRRVLVAGLVGFAACSLVAGGMLLLVYGLIEAPDVGWGKPRTIATLSAAALILVAFVVNERRRRSPLMHLSIFRVKGLAAADATWLLAMAGLFAMFFFL